MAEPWQNHALGVAQESTGPYGQSQPPVSSWQRQTPERPTYSDPNAWSSQAHVPPSDQGGFGSPGSLDFMPTDMMGGDGGDGMLGSDAAAQQASGVTGGMMMGGLGQSSGGGGFNAPMQPLYSEEDYSNEPPLLEELDINFSHILGKTKAVLRPFSMGAEQYDELLLDSDLTGPIFFLVCLGCSLLLQGKVSFGYIYGFGIFGCASLYVLLNLLSPPAAPPINIWQVTSTLGYCLLPVVVVALAGIVVQLNGVVGNVLALLAIAWCTTTATRNFERSLSMVKQRYLIAYPTGLLYAIFVLITIF